MPKRRSTRGASARKVKPELAPEEHAKPAAPIPPTVPEPVAVPEQAGVPPVPQSPPPEVAFAARVPPPEPERPRPEGRRAVFFDVENTSRSSDVKRMLEQLAIDRSAWATELVASGNWRVIGYETARLLAAHGAHLVHSAPATGVRDWSDLRIAVAAGVWLASARPGDQLDIVSDDKAFDVLGDAAAGLGVHFRRLSYRDAARTERAAATARTLRRGRRRGGTDLGTAQVEHPPHEGGRAQASMAHPAPGTGESSTTTPEAADDQILTVVKELMAASPTGVTLDAVAKRLRELGFLRAPGSPRLVTRVRALEELEVASRGMIRLRGAASASAGSPEPAAAAGEAAAPKNGRRRRGGRGRRRAKTPA